MSTGCKSSLVNQVTSCLFSFVVELPNWFNLEGSKTVAPKIPRVVCLSHPCTFRHSSVFCGEGRQVRPAELGKQPVELWMNYQASNPESLSETPESLSETPERLSRPRREVVHQQQQQQQRNEQQKC